MTALLIIIIGLLIGNAVLLCLVLLALRDALATIIAQGSQRRQWAREEKAK